MRTFSMICAMALAGGVQAQSPDAAADLTAGIEIGGLVWATRNVAEAGKFTADPEDFGGYFTFEEAKTACPEGWRPPTMQECYTLINAASEWVTVNEVNGRRFGTAPATIFLPAAGVYQKKGDEKPDLVIFGNYWSGDAPDIAEYNRHKAQDLLVVGLGMSFSRVDCMESFGSAEIMTSLRCVKD